MSELFSEAHALQQDSQDDLRHFREQFFIPQHEGREQAYFCGNSLGLQPRSLPAALTEELTNWAENGVEGHFNGKHPWMPYHEFVRDSLASVVGAMPSEVVAMNSLSVNLHLMMVSFYRPTKERNAILIEAGAFPSDRYAVESQVRFHGFDPAESLIEIEPDLPGGIFSMQHIEKIIAEHGHRIALILWPGVQYRTGQYFDLTEITRLGHAAGCKVGFDLAHAAGNLPLNLHDSGADFAAWCSYKYLNSGPGAIAGCFVHDRHANAKLPRFAGWWGHDKTTRFKMGPEFIPTPGADGWQLSNPPIFALAPLRISLEIFQQADMQNLRKKSVKLTAYLEALIQQQLANTLTIATPANPDQRGCQLSLRVNAGREQGRALFEALSAQGIIGDWREPDVIRISPTPLYNNHSDVLRFIRAVKLWQDAHHAS
ncbi:MAG TPA: kynureninase [Arenimonas sp.]|nr:kynureninase [Arenimonas sp.]HOZ04196.1 kynureninase [Arenimonas sp.]HPO25114.1 kynureninase [Arenimonas sp.]HPW31322.1 kynureninase [Arenimonas sp.]